MFCLGLEPQLVLIYIVCDGFVDLKSGLKCLGSLTSRFFQFGIVLLSRPEVIEHFC